MLTDKLDRRQAADRGVRADVVVIDSPVLDGGARVEKRREGILVEQLVAKASVEALNAAVLRWFSWLDEV